MDRAGDRAARGTGRPGGQGGLGDRAGDRAAQGTGQRTGWPGGQGRGQGGPGDRAARGTKLETGRLADLERFLSGVHQLVSFQL